LQRRVPALILITLLVALGAPSVAAAQEVPPAVGTPVTYVDPEGIIRGEVTVREIADPFTEHEPSAPPPEGMRYVSLIATFQAAIDQTFEAQPWQVVLQDTDGVLYGYQHVPRPAEAVMPELQGQTMAPDNRISGQIGYIVPVDVTLDRVIYQPASDRLIELADLAGGGGPAPGGAVTYTAADGSSATISASLIDPFTAFEPTAPPPEGTRFVVLQPVFENTGQRPYFADPYDVAVRDVNGFIYPLVSVYQPEGAPIPALEGQTMSPGDRLSGYVGFALPTDARIADILYFPESSRIVTLADLAGGAAPASQPASGSPAPAATPAAPASLEPGATAGTGR
jgi:hypothetical protein